MKVVASSAPSEWLPFASRMRARAFSLPTAEASFARHGFPGRTSPSRAHLEGVIGTFISGFNLAVVSTEGQLTAPLDASYPESLRGFAYEGVGLWLALRDLVMPWGASRLARFTKDVAPQHDFITMVGAGFAVARVPYGLRRLEAYQTKLDPFTAWCVADGVGFHDGFFHWRRYQTGQLPAPSYLHEQNRALFDAGVGRALWWVYGAQPDPIADAIARFDSCRQPEMWTGIGTALVYAGGHGVGTEARLLERAGSYRRDLLSGIALGANLRHKSGCAAPWSEAVCADVFQQSVAATSAAVDADVADYLAAWDGTPRSMRERCYLELRARLTARYADQGGRGR